MLKRHLSISLDYADLARDTGIYHIAVKKGRVRDTETIYLGLEGDNQGHRDNTECLFEIEIFETRITPLLFELA